MKQDEDARRLADKLLKGNSPLRTVFENVPHPLCLLLPDQDPKIGARFVAMNEAAQKQCGVSAEKVAGMRVVDILPENQPDGTLSCAMISGMVEETGKQPVVFHPHMRMRRQDGSEWNAECSAREIEIGGRKLIIATPKDITDRLKAERALHESENRFHRLFLQAPVGMTVVDLDGRFIRINPAYCDMLGYTEKELLGRTIRDITHPEDIARDTTAISKMIDGSLRIHETEKRYLHKNGKLRWGSLRVSLLRDKTGRPQNFLAIVRDITAQREAAENLRESEEKFRRLFNEAPVGIGLTGLDGRFIQNNPAYCRLLGYSTEELKGKRFADITHPDDAEAGVEAAKNLSQGKILFYETDKRYLRKDGSIVWVHIRVTLLRDKNKKPQCFLTSVEDITWRRRMEEILRDSEEKFRNLFSQSPVPMALYGFDRTILQANPAYCRMHGEPEKRLIGRNFADWTHPDDLKGNVREGTRLLRGEISFFHRESRRRRENGTLIWVNVHLSLMRDADGEPRSMLAIVEDITWRKKAESDLRESERKFRDFFMQSPMGIASLNPDFGIREVNPAFAKMLGYTVPELLRKSMPEITLPENVSKNKRQIARVLEGEIPFFQIEKSYRRKDKSMVRARVTSSSIKDKDGKPLYSMAMIEDISWQREAEAALRERERLALAGEIATGIAHEINNPLNIILGLAEVADSEHKLPAKVRKDLASIAAHAKRAGAVTRGLLQFGRRTKPRTELVSLGDILETAVTLVAADLKRSKIKLAVRKPKDSVRVCVDPNQLQQVLINLVLNAKQALADHPRKEISLDSGKSGKFGFIRVTDSGPGIPKKLLNKVFEPFFTTRPPGEGSGLGLAISRSIAAENNGRLSVSSSRKGAAFTLELPIKCPPENTACRARRAHAHRA